jgi:hypothetical protein
MLWHKEYSDDKIINYETNILNILNKLKLNTMIICHNPGETIRYYYNFNKPYIILIDNMISRAFGEKNNDINILKIEKDKFETIIREPLYGDELIK